MMILAMVEPRIQQKRPENSKYKQNVQTQWDCAENVAVEHQDGPKYFLMNRKHNNIHSLNHPEYSGVVTR